MKWIYKITYPNGKIYVGKDLTGSYGYFGSVKSETIQEDFSFEEIKTMEISREIVWYSENASDKDVNKKEVELIRQYDSNNPEIGYNRWPKYKKKM